ncbi:MAG: M48 family metalloprotease [Myxococcaceae bacterium]
MRARLPLIAGLMLLAACADEKLVEKQPVGNKAQANPSDAGAVDAGSLDLQQGDDKPVELTGAQAAAVQAMRALSESLDKCRAMKEQPLDIAEEQRRGHAIIGALTEPAHDATVDAGVVVVGASGVTWPAVAKQTAIDAYLKKVGAPLGKRTDRATVPWDFSVHGDPQPALEWSIGGYVSVSVGAFNAAANEAELAAMLAHALAHAASTETMSDYRVFEEKLCLARALANSERDGMQLDLGGLSVNKGLQGDLLKQYAWAKNDAEVIAGLDKTFRLKKTVSFATKDEISTDEAAVRMLTAEGYDASVYADAMEKLAANPLWAKAHPMNDDRRHELDLGLSGFKRAHPKVKKPNAIPKELRK